MMKVFAIALFALLFILGGVSFLLSKHIDSTTKPLTSTKSTSSTTTAPTIQDAPQVSIVAENLEVPWALVFLPDKSILFTERPGRVRMIDASGNLQQQPVATIADVFQIGEGGLLGIAVDPKFAENKFVYVYYTYANNGGTALNRLVRYAFDGKSLNDRTVLLEGVPGNSNHDGGRIKFGPDGFLYITTGDAENPSQAQDRNALGGKVLRVTTEGKPAPGNPFGTAIYSYGHRNPQGLAWDASGNLWETEHGRSGVLSGLDEVNLIKPGQNYGWPIIQGDQTLPGMITPVKNSGATTTWAPSGLAFLNGSLFFGGLRGQTLYEAVLQGDKIGEFKEHFAGQFGRLRDVVVGPDGLLYITTSNRDGRGSPKENDDKILRVNPNKL